MRLIMMVSAKGNLLASHNFLPQAYADQFEVTIVDRRFEPIGRNRTHERSPI